MIDLRSDTVTKPSAAMRAAMAAAEVGDDVYGEDPTVRQLEERVAELVGAEAALFVPSGTMANQLALGVCTRPGDEVIVGANAHNWLFETGAAAAVNGVQHCVVPGDGTFTAEDVRAHYKPDNHHFAATSLVSIENTHNVSGGRVWPLARVDEVLAAAREKGLRAHLDGARIWNAAVATETKLDRLCRGFDVVSVCMSKGLGAPVGSLLCGSAERIHQAHRLRKMLGGGMRQAGVLAAAGLYALDHHLDRLRDDHERAQRLASSLASCKHLHIDVGAVDTNIVVAEVRQPLTARALVAKAAEAGVLTHEISSDCVRLVTHLDIDDRAIDVAIDAISRAAEAP